MGVLIVSSTESPITVIGNAAGTSTGKGKPGSSRNDQLTRRVKNCFNNGHLSVFEFADIVFYISGISRTCSHQLVRHRHFSFCQQSQRYTKVNTKDNDWYVTPIGLDDGTKKIFSDMMKVAGEAYNIALMSKEVNPENARFLLPEATKTNISVKCNLRSFYEFLDLREQKEAQWEIRNLAFEMESKVRDISKDWKFLMDLRYN